jgi:hypothetical protein
MGKDVKIGLSVLAVLVGLLGYVCYHKFQSPSVHTSDALAKLREKLSKGNDGAAQAAADMSRVAEGGKPSLDPAASAAAANAWSGAPTQGDVEPAQYAADATGTAPSGVEGAAWTIEDDPPVDGGQAGAAAPPGDASPFGAPGQATDPAYADAGSAAPGNEVVGEESPYGNQPQEPYDSDPAAAGGAALANEQFAPAEWSGGEETAAADPADGQPLEGQVDDGQSLAGDPAYDQPAYDEPAAGYAQQEEPLKFDDSDGAPLADKLGAAATAAGDAALQAADEALGSAAQAGQQQLDAIDDAASGGDVRLAAGRKAPAAQSSQPHSLFQRAEEKLEESEHDVVDDAVTDAADTRSRRERVQRLRHVLPIDHTQLEARRASVDDEDVTVQYGHVQSRISGSSSPFARV